MPGLLGERRAVALGVLGFITTIFFLMALAQGGAWLKCFLALSATYGLGFFALASEWFWARWYVMGLGASGMTLAGLGLLTSGWNWGLALWGIFHALVYLPLLGDAMAARYENQQAWRERYKVDDYGVVRLKRAIRGAATALPTMILYTLAPRQEGYMVLLLALVGLGVFGLVRLRFWGVALLGCAAVWSGLSTIAFISTPFAAQYIPLFGALGTCALIVAVAPFVRPAWRFLNRPGV